jgi:hypothetical protein
LPASLPRPASPSRVALRAPDLTVGFALDRCACRDRSLAGNPAQIQLQEPTMTTDVNISSRTGDARSLIVARAVDDSERLMALPRHFGHRLMIFEGTVYTFMRRVAPDYTGGLWQFLELSNQGFYMAPEEQRTYRLSVDTNGYEGVMSADAAGITVCLFTYSHLSFEYFGDEAFAEHFHRLRDFALEHAEASAIFAAID